MLRYLALIAALLWLPAPPAVAEDDMNFIITLEQPDVQRRVEQMFPRAYANNLLNIRLAQPEVILREGSDRIGLRIQVSVKVAGDVATSGLALLDGQLRYQSKTGEFFLDNAAVRELKVQGLAEAYQEPARQLAQAAAREVLRSRPVYVLGQSGEPRRFLGSELKKVSVRDGKLALELAMF